MKKVVPSLILGLALFSQSVLSLADDKNLEDTSTQNKSLNITKKRLDELIISASKQDLVSLHKPKKTLLTNRKSMGSDVSILSKSEPECVSMKIVNFPVEARVASFEDLQEIRNQIVVGPDMIDKAKVRILALSYLGLGFGEEALVAARDLDDPERSQIQNMAKIIINQYDDENLKVVKSRKWCVNHNNIWYYLTTKGVLSADKRNQDEFVGQLQALPSGLRDILGPRVGIQAFKKQQYKLANDILIMMRTFEKAPADEETKERKKDIKNNSALSFLEGLIGLQKSDFERHQQAVEQLRRLAQHEGEYQVEALEALGKLQPAGIAYYPGYAEDIDMAIQIFSTKPEAQKALQLELKYRVDTEDYRYAIGLIKQHYKPGSIFYRENAQNIGDHVLKGLKDGSSTVRLGLLSLVLDEKKFFDNMRENEEFWQACVLNSASLGLPSLAQKFVAPHEWKHLNADVMVALVSSFMDENDRRFDDENFKKYFPYKLFKDKKLQARQVLTLLKQGQTTRAWKLFHNTQDAPMLKRNFIDGAWETGNWSLVSQAVSRPISNKMPKNENSKLQTSMLSESEIKLVDSLGLASPLLLETNHDYEIQNLTALLAYLDSEMEVFSAYRSRDLPELKVAGRG